MHELNDSGYFLYKSMRAIPELCYLLENFSIRTTLMPYPGSRKQTATVTSFKNTDTEIYVFAKTHGRESANALYTSARTPMLKLRG